MKPNYPPKVQAAIDSLLTKAGNVAPALRQAVEGYAAKLSGSQQDAPALPADLTAYVDKVTLHAYKVTDKDIQQLIAAGYSEDAIFEITLCAAVGAGLGRFERGLTALKGAVDASKNS